MVSAGVQHLVACGCQRIGLLANGSAAEFRQAVATHGVRTKNAWICADLEPAVRGTGTQAFHSLWGRTGVAPDGLVILDDMLFADAQLAMLALGVRAPQDVQLAVQVTAGACPASPFPYTALTVAGEKAAAFLVDRLQHRLSGEASPPMVYRIPFSLRSVPVKKEGRRGAAASPTGP